MSNGGIIGPYNSSSIVKASGIWNLNDVHTSRKNESWPKVPSTLTFRTSATRVATTGTLAIVHPAGVVAGDLCIAIHCCWDNDDDYVVQAPTGFTILHSRLYPYTGTTPNQTYLSFVISYRVLTDTTSGSFPSAVQFSNGAGTTFDNQGSILLYFYLDKPIESVKLLQTSYAAVTGDPAARSITASNFTNVPLLVLANQVIQTGTPAFNVSTNPTFTGTVINTAPVNVEMIAGYTIYNTNPASDHTIDMDEISTGAAKQFSAYLLSVQ